jgi:hypothetical protein
MINNNFFIVSASGMSSRAYTVPENLSSRGGFHPGSEGSNANTDSFKMMSRHSSDLHLVAGRNVVLNYGQTANFYDRSLVRRNSGRGNKENQVPAVIGSGLPPPPPPELSEETLMSPEHNEILSKLRFVSLLVDTIIEVARHKAAPLSAITESGIRPQNASAGSNLGNIDVNSPQHRRLQQLLLYMRCLHLLSQTLEFSRAELKAKKLKPSTSVKNGQFLNHYKIQKNRS